MIPDNVEKIVMTKQDYDRNVEQLLFDKVKAEQKLERYKNIIDEIERYFIDMFNRTQDTKYLDDLQKLKELKGE